MPPVYFIEGPKKGQGIADMALKELIQNLPQYQHTFSYAPLKRAQSYLKQGKNYCVPSLIKTKERLTYSIMTKITNSMRNSGVVVKLDNLDKLRPYIDKTNKIVDLKALLKNTSITAGIRKNKSYNKEISSAISANRDQKNIFTTIKSKHLFAMLQNDRVDYIFGYDYETAHFKKETKDTTPYVYVQTTEKNNPILSYIACSKTNAGAQIVNDINAVLYQNGISIFKKHSDRYVEGFRLKEFH